MYMYIKLVTVTNFTMLCLAAMYSVDGPMKHIMIMSGVFFCHVNTWGANTGLELDRISELKFCGTSIILHTIKSKDRHTIAALDERIP